MYCRGVDGGCGELMGACFASSSSSELGKLLETPAVRLCGEIGEARAEVNQQDT